MTAPSEITRIEYNGGFVTPVILALREYPRAILMVKDEATREMFVDSFKVHPDRIQVEVSNEAH
ncbi:MAG: hypothetical protein A4E65_01160 [Syntrophorhabdus sp. PtaU1.Bin153]|nr:MAG: hypothetical protein A4E65_01160 [Syntrophorhabdus sp. PtaU1.Bin153]